MNEVNNPICVSTEAEQDKGKGQIAPEIEVSIALFKMKNISTVKSKCYFVTPVAIYKCNFEKV